MGRKKAQHPKDQHIRISLKTRIDLWEIKRQYAMPSKYQEAETIDAMIAMLKNAVPGISLAY